MDDEHRADVLGFSGNRVVRTPNLDRLAADAIVFNNAYTASPICTPGRQCMMTGKLPLNCGCQNYGEDLAPGAMTFSRVFSQHAYHTVACGKLHHTGQDQMQGWRQRIGADIQVHPEFIEGRDQEAFRDQSSKRGCLKWSEAKEIARFEYERLQVMRIVERASTPQGELQLFTDLVPFPNPPSDPRADNTLLIYTAQLAHQKWKRLITAFPMKPVAVEELKATVSKREVPIRLRYNAYVRGLYGKTFAGSRQFLSE